MNLDRDNTTVTQVLLGRDLFRQIRALRADHGITQRVFFDIATREALAKTPEQWAEIARLKQRPSRDPDRLTAEIERLRVELAEAKAAVPAPPVLTLKSPLVERAMEIEKDLGILRVELKPLEHKEMYEDGGLSPDEQQRLAEVRAELVSLTEEKEKNKAERAAARGAPSQASLPVAEHTGAPRNLRSSEELRAAMVANGKLYTQMKGTWSAKKLQELADAYDVLRDELAEVEARA